MKIEKVDNGFFFSGDVNLYGIQSNLVNETSITITLPSNVFDLIPGNVTFLQAVRRDDTQQDVWIKRRYCNPPTLDITFRTIEPPPQEQHYADEKQEVPAQLG